MSRSSTPIQLIVGLGNPGPQYDGTRHNAGARFVEALAHRYRITLASESRYFGRVGRGRIGSEDVRLLIPDTYMNLSGKSVLALANFFKILPPAILVAHDELDLAPGVARLKHGGGHGGHNGLRDVIAALANSRDFCRLRLGIGHPGNARDVVDYVLNRAPAEEREKLDAAIDASLDVIEDAVAGNWSQAQNRLHTFTA